MPRSTLPVDQKCFRLLKYLFQQYAAGRELTTDQMLTIHILDFMSAGVEILRDLSTSDLEALQEGLELEDDTFQTVDTLLSKSSTGSEILAHIWPLLTLAPRPPLRHPVRFLNLAVSFGYDDERLVHFSVPMYPPEGLPFTDAFIVGLLTNEFGKIVAMIASHGADSLFEQQAVSITKLPPPAVES